jgi:3-oxoacyl-[acyl-carrier-protein] synthase II
VKSRCITGLGIVSPLGTGREAFFDGLARALPLAHSPLYPVESFDTSELETPNISEVRGFDPSKYLGDKGLRTLDRLTKLMVVASRLSLQDAGIKREGDGVFIHGTPDRTGIVSSNAYGSLEAIVELDRVAKFEDARYINPAKFPNTVANSASGYVSIWENLKALNVAVSDGNCGALDAVACADIYLATDRADTLLVGGAEAMSEGLYVAFQKFGALSEYTRLSEGAAFFTVERETQAAARSARVLGRIAGFGTAFLPPADDSTLIYASAAALERAVREALRDACMDAQDIDAVASSMPGIAPFDAAESEALRSVFPAGTRICNPKALFGETLGAGGAMGMATALAWLSGVPVSPVAFGSGKGHVRATMVTSMGLYGNASAVVMTH